MRKRLGSVITVAALVAAACSSSTTTTAPTTGTTTPTTPPVVTPAPSPTAATVQLTGSTYKATDASVKGGKVVLAEWQYPDTLNPYYAQAETDIEVTGSMFDGLLAVTPDLRYNPDLASNVPTVD